MWHCGYIIDLSISSNLILFGVAYTSFFRRSVRRIYSPMKMTTKLYNYKNMQYAKPSIGNYL